MRKWTVEVNIDGGYMERQITFVVEATSAKSAINHVEANMMLMRFRRDEYQAHIV